MTNQTFYCCISTVETRAALLENIYGSSLKWLFPFCRLQFDLPNKDFLNMLYKRKLQEVVFEEYPTSPPLMTL